MNVLKVKSAELVRCTLVEVPSFHLKNEMSDKLLEVADEKMRENIRNEIGLNKETMQEAVEIIKKWMQQQPHLPEDYDDVRIERFLLSCKNSLEKTKQTLDTYYTIKAIVPDYMTGWDPDEDWFRKIHTVTYIYPVRQLTSEGDRIIITGFSNADATNFDTISVIKWSCMMTEIRLREDHWRSHILVIDFTNFPLGCIPKVTLPAARKSEIILLKAYKCRVKAIHLLNLPPIAEFLINTLKSLLKPKVAARVKIHGKDLTELYKDVPKHLLPSDFGGDGEPIAQQNELWRKKLESEREWLLEREKVKSNEERRLGKPVDSGDIFGFEGSFRKLDLD